MIFWSYTGACSFTTKLLKLLVVKIILKSCQQLETDGRLKVMVLNDNENPNVYFQREICLTFAAITFSIKFWYEEPLVLAKFLQATCGLQTKARNIPFPDLCLCFCSHTQNIWFMREIFNIHYQAQILLQLMYDFQLNLFLFLQYLFLVFFFKMC